MNETANIEASHYQKYDVNIRIIVESGWITSDCADITFINTAPVVGGDNVSVKGMVLTPGQFMCVTANDGEMDVTQWEAIFAGAGTPNLTVIRKVYRR